jgi:hypothetical protein
MIRSVVVIVQDDDYTLEDVIFSFLYGVLVFALPLLVPNLVILRFLIETVSNSWIYSTLHKTTFWFEFRSLIYGSHRASSPSPFEILGNVTVVAFLDKEGILAQTSALPEHILFFESQKPVLIDCLPQGIRDHELDEYEQEEHSSLLKLNVTSNTGFAIEFERDIRPHVNSLKTIGLSCLLSASCSGIRQNSVPKSEVASAFERISFADPLVGLEDGGQWDCLCLVASEMGFHKPLTLSTHVPLAVVHTVASDYVIPSFGAHTSEIPGGLSRRNSMVSMPILRQRIISSLPVQCGRTNVLQMFCRGTPSLILEHSDFFWDGEGIYQLRNSQRQRLSTVVKRWLHDDLKVLALCYTPIPPQHSHFVGDIVPRTLVMEDRIDDLDSGLPDESTLEDKAEANEKETEESDDSSSSEDEKEKNPIVRKRARRESWTPRESDEKSLSELSDQKNPGRISAIETQYRRLQTGQVFLGLVATRHQPTPEVPQLVDELHRIGVRFVFFSSMNRRKSIAFAERIGLETDWNFYISLKDAPVDSHAREASPANSGAHVKHKKHNVSKLPVGVSSIREHLEKIDNVPLLVSLFTDSTFDTAAEMIKIMQENGETVLIFGSDQKPENIFGFMQADLATAVHPLAEFEGCLLDVNRNIARVHNPFLPRDLEYENVLEELSALLTSVPCAFALPENASLKSFCDDVLFLGRRLAANAAQVC